MNRDSLLKTILNLSGSSCKVLLYLACLADEENSIDVKISSALDKLGIKKPTFVSSIKELKEMGLIEVIRYDGRSYKIRIALNDDDIASLIKDKIQETLF